MPTLLGPSTNQQEADNSVIGQFWRNAVTDVRELAPALVTGPILLARDVLADVGSVPFGDADFSRTRKTLGGAARGFIEESPLVSVGKAVTPLGGSVGEDLGEMRERWFERPVTGSMDLIGGAAFTRGLTGRAARAAAPTLPAGWQPRAMQHAGFHQIDDPRKSGLVKPEDTTFFRYGPAQYIGDKAYARPTHRRMLPSWDSTMLLKDPASVYSRRKLPKEKFHDLDRKKPLDPELAERLEAIDSWKRISRNPWWAGVSRGLADLRSELIRSEGPFSSTKALDRRMAKDAEKGGYISNAVGTSMHEKANFKFHNQLAKKMKERGITDAKTIDLIADWTTYLAALGYSNIRHFTEDMRHTHGTHPLESVQGLRMARKQRDIEKLKPRINELMQQIDELGPRSPEAADLRIQLASLMKNAEQARAARATSKQYIDKRLDPKPKGKDDPTSGYKNRLDELKPIASFIDEALDSDYIEPWLDDMELASLHAERIAMENHGYALPKEAIINNRYRAADLYTAEGPASQAVRERYHRVKKGTNKTRRPLFVPMMSRKKDSMAYRHGKDRNPMGYVDESALPDPMNMELWGSNVTEVITKGIMMRKHMQEIQTKNFNKLRDNLRKMAIPMSKKQVEQFTDMHVHGERTPVLSRIEKNGMPSNPAAPFVALGEFQDVINHNANLLDDVAREMTNKDMEFEGNLLRKEADRLRMTDPIKRGNLRTTRNLSAMQVQRATQFQPGMDVVLPTQTYLSVIDKMVETTEAIVRIGGAPSLSGSAARNYGKAMKYWRYSILHTRPKWIVNNAIGSIYMLAMQEGWGKAFADIIRHSTMFKWAMEFLGIEKKKLDRGGDRYISEVVESKFQDVLYAQGSTTMFGHTEKGMGVANRFHKFMDKIADFNAKIADNPARSARIRQLLDEYVDSYKQRRGGKVTKSDDAIRLELLDDMDIRDHIAQVALEDMIDFQDLKGFERKMIAYAVPFWSWIKGSTKATARHFADSPGRMMSHAYLGKEGHRQLEEQFPGGIPSYLWGALPGGFTGGDPTGVVNLAGVSPAQSTADFITMAAQMMPGGVPMQFGTESPFGMMAPTITATVGALTQRHPFFGTPIAKDRGFWNTVWDIAQPPAWRSAYRGTGLVGEQPWAVRGEGAPTYLGGEGYQPSGKAISEHDPSSYFWRLVFPHKQNIVAPIAAERAKEEVVELGGTR